MPHSPADLELRREAITRQISRLGDFRSASVTSTSGRCETKVVPGDRAKWIWNLASQHFPGAIRIVARFHARQCLWELARQPYPNDEAGQKRWIGIQQNRLGKGKQSIDTTLPEVAAFQRPPEGEAAHRSRVLRDRHRTHALPQVPRPAPVRRLGSD
jgi:hypothetical protein